MPLIFREREEPLVIWVGLSIQDRNALIESIKSHGGRVTDAVSEASFAICDTPQDVISVEDIQFLCLCVQSRWITDSVTRGRLERWTKYAINREGKPVVPRTTHSGLKYMDEELRSMVRYLATEPRGIQTEIWSKFHRKYPHRTTAAWTQCFRNRRDFFMNGVNLLRAGKFSTWNIPALSEYPPEELGPPSLSKAVEMLAINKPEYTELYLENPRPESKGNSNDLKRLSPPIEYLATSRIADDEDRDGIQMFNSLDELIAEEKKKGSSSARRAFFSDLKADLESKPPRKVTISEDEKVDLTRHIALANGSVDWEAFSHLHPRLSAVQWEAYYHHRKVKLDARVRAIGKTEEIMVLSMEEAKVGRKRENSEGEGSLSKRRRIQQVEALQGASLPKATKPAAKTSFTKKDRLALVTFLITEDRSADFWGSWRRFTDKHPAHAADEWLQLYYQEKSTFDGIEKKLDGDLSP